MTSFPLPPVDAGVGGVLQRQPPQLAEPDDRRDPSVVPVVEARRNVRSPVEVNVGRDVGNSVSMDVGIRRFVCICESSKEVIY